MITEDIKSLNSGTRTIICAADSDPNSKRSDKARLEECAGLANAIGLQVVHSYALSLKQPKAATLLGSGQVDNLAAMAAQYDAGLIIIDHGLTAIQQRNLEEKLEIKVIDRTGLILEIFGARAATAEGRLQVELAHLDYQAGRLVRSWTHLERQRGGFGFLGGPGETQIESDRRMIRNRMSRLRKSLEDVRRTRGLHRKRRKEAPWPVIALVGYTNAGKSTLFNALTGSDVLAKDLLFATLDPAMRAVNIAGIEKAIISDTVGFVSNLPTQLVAAFRATLEEVISADLVVHVRDMSSEHCQEQRDDVESILTSLGLYLPHARIGDEDLDDVILEDDDQPEYMEVWNKCDLLDADAYAQLAEAESSVPHVMMSAVTGKGLDEFQQLVSQILLKHHREYHVKLDIADGQKLSWLYMHGKVQNVQDDGKEIELDVRLSEKNWGQFQKMRA